MLVGVYETCGKSSERGTKIYNLEVLEQMPKTSSAFLPQLLIRNSVMIGEMKIFAENIKRECLHALLESVCLTHDSHAQ